MNYKYPAQCSYVARSPENSYAAGHSAQGQHHSVTSSHVCYTISWYFNLSKLGLPCSFCGNSCVYTGAHASNSGCNSNGADSL